MRRLTLVLLVLMGGCKTRLFDVVSDGDGGLVFDLVMPPVIDLRDNDGKYFVKERVEMMSKGPDAKGWQDYKFMNPVSRAIEPKSMYLHRFEDLIVGCGIYKG